MVFESLCQFASRIPPFSTIAQTRENEDMGRAVAFLSPLLSLSVLSVYSAAYLVSTVAFTGIALLLFASQNPPFLLAPISLLGGVLSYYSIVTHPERIMDGYRVTLSEHADMIFEQFVLVYASGGTVFDAIEMIAQSGYPYLSRAFGDMLLQIQDGVPPEHCLSEFAKNQPSKDLRRYITAILSSSERETVLLDSLSGKSFEADMALRKKNLELESRLLIVSALSTYLPIVITLAISLSGFAQNWVVLLMAPLLIGIHYSLKSRFADDFSVYFDMPNPQSEESYSQQLAIDEYDEFLNLLMLLGERLSSGDTCEIALIEIRDKVNPPVESLLDIILASIYHREESLSDAFHEARKHAIGLRVARLFRIIPLMCERSAKAAGERISMIASRLVERSATAKERDSIIEAQKLKVLLLSITSSIVLGLITSLSPFLNIGALLDEGPFSVSEPAGLTDVLPLTLTLALVTGSAGYQNAQMIGFSHPKAIGVVSVFAFWVTLALSGMLLGTNNI